MQKGISGAVAPAASTVFGMDLKLTADQQAAMNKVRDWLATAKGGDVFRLYGLAGCGKTTCSVRLKDFGVRVLFVAFTNRAVSVLEGKGCVPARTLHSILYDSEEYSEEEKAEQRAMRRAYLDAVEAGVPADQRPPVPMSNRRVGFRLRDAAGLAEQVRDYDAIAVDEASMVGRRIGMDLKLLNKPIIAIGDPGQLQPVGDEPFFSPHNPDVLLTEVLRTDNDILELAAHVRKGGSFLDIEEGNRFKIRRKALPEWFDNSEQIICGIHSKRRELNTHVRRLNGWSGWIPNPGEKLLAVANNKDERIMNGTLWNVVACQRMGDYVALDLVEFAPRKKREDLELRFDVHVHIGCFQKDIKDATEIGIEYSRDSVLMTWGYAITAHKSQGSEWNSVMVFDDGHVFRNQTNEWRYTAVTRAAQHLFVISRH